MDTTGDVFSRYCGAFLNPIGIEVNVPICGKNLCSKVYRIVLYVGVDISSIPVSFLDCTAPFMVEIRTDATSDNAAAANTQQSFGKNTLYSMCNSCTTCQKLKLLH